MGKPDRPGKFHYHGLPAAVSVRAFSLGPVDKVSFAGIESVIVSGESETKK
jgi:hypothetical protein